MICIVSVSKRNKLLLLILIQARRCRVGVAGKSFQADSSYTDKGLSGGLKQKNQND